MGGFSDSEAGRLNCWLLFTGQECAELRIPWENVQLEKQKSICEANFAWIFACCWNGVNSNKVSFVGMDK